MDFNVCACMGPMYDEPHCYCEMISRGLPLNEAARAADNARLDSALQGMFAPVDDAQP